MKPYKITLIAIAIILFAYSSCKKSSTTETTPTTSSIVQQGTWRITLFNENGTDNTSHFTGYSFSFNSNGTVTATKGTSTVNGTWTTGSDDSLNKFQLDFGAAVPFSEINNDWHVIEKSSAKIRLQDISGGQGGTELLTFEKN